jgi:AraC-like DNA-binding protein
MLKLEWDKENNKITLGVKEWTSYSVYKDSISWAIDVLAQNNLYRPIRRHYKGKERRLFNKAVGDAFGCSYSVLYQHFKKLQYKAFIGDDVEILKKFCQYNFGKGWKPSEVNIMNRNREILRQTYDDGLYNLIPIVAASGLSPKDLKAKFKEQGIESRWKTITKNSLNKNRALSQSFSSCFSDYKSLLEDAPTVLLKNHGYLDRDTLAYLKTNFKGNWGKQPFITREARIFKDTRDMAEQIGETFNPNWSSRRVHEQHSLFSKKINSAKFPDENIQVLDKISVREIEHEGYKATLLTTPLQIWEEGTEMGHCVGAYVSSVKDYGYLVYSVSNNGEKSSTIGIQRDRELFVSMLAEPTFIYRNYSVQQHYGKFNAHVTDDNEKEIAKILVEKLNEMLENEMKVEKEHECMS